MPPVLRGWRLLSAHLADGSELGMLHDPELGAYTAVVVLHARAVSLLPPAEHERRLEQWGQVLAALARRGSAIRRLQIIEHTAPSDGHLRQPAALRWWRRASLQLAQPPSETIQPRKTRSRGDHATRLTTRSSRDPEVQLWAPRAAPTFGAARDLTQGVVVDSVNVSDLP